VQDPVRTSIDLAMVTRKPMRENGRPCLESEMVMAAMLWRYCEFRIWMRFVMMSRSFAVRASFRYRRKALTASAFLPACV
jgi:hypothetical protein